MGGVVKYCIAPLGSANDRIYEHQISVITLSFTVVVIIIFLVYPVLGWEDLNIFFFNKTVL